MTTHTLPASRAHNIAAGVWRVADPKITLASVASMLIGIAAAAWQGPIAWSWFALTVLGIFCVEAAKNASGEIFDWDSGDDEAVTPDERSPFSGGKRVIVDGLLTRRETAIVAGVFYAVAIAVGCAIAVIREPAALWIGMIGVALAFFYHAPPLKLSYRGFGELAVALAYGPVIATGTYLVQRHAFDARAIAATVPLALALGSFLWINEFPDARADALAGKRTLVVRLGRPLAARVFPFLIAAAYAAVALLPLAHLPMTLWLGLIGLPHGLAAARRLRANPETVHAIIPAQGQMLLSFVLMAAGIAAGFVIAPS
jgi:1,4-dihydroxy-2-naphthoate octaprenyltransferase